MSKNIQLRHIPPTVHAKLKAQAASLNLSLAAYLTRELLKIAERTTIEEMRQRLGQRESYVGSISPTEALRAERESR